MIELLSKIHINIIRKDFLSAFSLASKHLGQLIFFRKLSMFVNKSKDILADQPGHDDLDMYDSHWSFLRNESYI